MAIRILSSENVDGALTIGGALTGTTASFTRLDINASNTKLKGDLLANTDAAYDIGASGANRPRNLYLSNSITAGDITTTGVGTFGGNVTTNGDIIIDNSSGDPFLKLKTSAQEYVIRVDQSDSEKFQIRDVTNSLTRITLDTSGNVGIGTTSPDYDLDVERTATTINDDPTIGIRNAWSGEGNNTGFSNRADLLNSAGAGAVIVRTRARYDATANWGEIGTTTAHDFNIRTSGTNRITVQAAGNVGIGVVNPETSRLLVRGSTNDSTSQIFQAANFGGASKYVIRADGDNKWYKSDNSLSMILTSGGNVGINTTSPDFKLEIGGTLGVSDLPFNASSTSILVANETLSAELVTNGDFDTDTNWSNSSGTNWSISGGKASISNTGNVRYFQQSGVLPNPSANKSFLIKWTISGLTQGGIGVNVGGYTTTTIQTSNGTYEQEVTPTNASSNTLVYLQSNANTIGSVDNVSVKEITSASTQIQKRSLGSGAFSDELWAVTPTDSSNIYNLNSGNVGIGTSTPLAKLDIQGTQGQLFSVTDDLSGSIFAVADISGVPIFDINSSGAITFGSYNGSNQTGTPTYILGTDASGNVVKTLSGGGTGGGFWQSSGNNIYNNNSGNVGVGTAYPDKQFSQEIIYYDTGTASQSGTTVTGVGTTFTQEMEGKKLIYADGTTTYITNFTNTTTITVGNTGTVASQAFGIYTPGVYMGRQSTAGNPPQLSIGGSGSGHHNLIIKGDISNGPNSVPSLQIARTQTGVTPGANEGLILSSSGSSHVFQTSDTKQLAFAVYDSNAASSAIAMYISGVTTPLVVINNTLVLQTVPLQTSTATKVLTYDNSSVKYVTPATLLNDAGGPYLPLAGGTMTGTGNISTPDNFDIRLGASNDLQLRHLGGTSGSNIENYTGALRITNFQDNGNIQISTDNGSGSVVEYLTLNGDTTHAYFTNPGNVGIGTTSPNTQLEIFNNNDQPATLRLSTSSTDGSNVAAIISFENGSDIGGVQGRIENIIDNNEDGSTSFKFYTNNTSTPAMTLFNSGSMTIAGARITNKLGVGSTTTPVVPLDVTGSDTGSAFGDGIARFANTTSVSSGGATVINIRNSYLGGFGTLIKFFRTSTSSSIANISFNTGGTAVNYNTGSDYRLKEDLKTFNGLDIIDNISVYNYKWKGVDFRGHGVLAHELASVFPDAVTGEKDAEEMQSVDYSKLVPVLIKSVQELKKEIELLKQQLNK